ncbi:MAG TPA: lytic murein transglycosylase [Solirubrobacteraceae bacterium]|nr:lytic murein transglycosylase [Solirubrobacteraceae bacterium]
MLSIERFEYVRMADLLAVVRLTGALDRDSRTAPADAALAVGFGSYQAMSPAREVRLERRPSRRRWDGGLLWSASFTVALEVVEYPAALFELAAPGRGMLLLPAPELREITAVFGAGVRGGRTVGASARRRAATAAVTLAFTATATPTAALAASDATTPAHAAASKHGRAGGVVHSLSAAAPVPVPHKHRLTLPHLVLAVPHPVAHKHPVIVRTHPGIVRTKTPSEPVHAAPTVPVHTLPVVPALPVHSEPAVPRLQLHADPVSPRKRVHPHPVHPRQPIQPTGGAPLIVPPAAKLPHLRITSPPTKTPAAAPAPVSAPSPEASLPEMSPTYVTSAESAAYSRLSALLANGDQPPAFLIPIYKAAARRYHVPWRVLAAINFIESDYGRNMSTSSAGAIGWMQFEPSTWLRYGVDVDHRGRPNPYNPHDAIFAAARYLAASGARHNLRQAIFSYNHATWYVDEVMATAEAITNQPLHASGRARRQLTAMRTMAHLLNGESYVWGGGHAGWELASGYDCSGFVSAVLHAGGYLAEPQTTQTLPSQQGIWRGPGRFVTIFDRTDAGLGSDHVIIDLDGQWWESGGSSADGGKASVHRITDISPAYLATFNLILHPEGL